MDSRRFPRIQVPLLVEIKHPTVGTHRCLARDISEGGIFVQVQSPQVKPGAKIRITLLNALEVETQPTPTVEMVVERVEEDGLGLSFVNATGRHLWQSVERLRTELAIGRDYFQVHLNVLVINAANAVLLVQHHGRWTFPAVFLEVGREWRESVAGFLEDDFGIDASASGTIAAMQSAGQSEVPEGAVLDLFVEARTASADPVARSGRYRQARWVDRRKDLEETTFASEQVRALADSTLGRLIQEDGVG